MVFRMRSSVPFQNPITRKLDGMFLKQAILDKDQNVNDSNEDYRSLRLSH